jgi:uncharacterized surface protein with fasciclin (FAS1) repeats
MRKFIAAAAVIAAAGATIALPVNAGATGKGGTQQRTLAEILLADSKGDDKNGFDRRFWDYDIVTEAVLLFPDLVDAASNPDAELTVFLPNDLAFRRLVYEITGNWIRAEADVFAAVASLGTDTVKNVLLYHIVPASISYRDAKRADGAELTTLLPDANLVVDVKRRIWKAVQIVDLDVNDRDAFVIRPNVGGAASNGYAHGITSVLRPIDLP